MSTDSPEKELGTQMSKIYPKDSIVTLGLQYYHEYDLIVKLLRDVDLVSEIAAVKKELGYEKQSMDNSLLNVLNVLQKRDVLTVVRQTANLCWDGSVRDVSEVITTKPFLYSEMIKLLEQTSSS